MYNNKDSVRQRLIITGRQLVKEKGLEFLTARKLSDASSCSIGTIYNQFGGMSDFIAEQNMLTLDELITYLSYIPSGKSSYQNLNNYVDCFVEFVQSNRQLWFLLYDFHLKNSDYKLSIAYKRRLVRLSLFVANEMFLSLRLVARRRIKLSAQVLNLTLMALSSLLASNFLQNMSLVNKNNLCKLVLNTYLAGIMVLNKD